MDTTSSFSAMYIGYGLAVFNQNILHRFSKFKFAAVLHLMMIILKAVLLAPKDKKTIEWFFFQLILDLFVFLVLFLKEFNQRFTFKKFFQAREEFKKFELLLSNHLPSSIFVLSARSQTLKMLFSNVAFQQEMGGDANMQISEKISNFVIDASKSLQNNKIGKDIESLISTVEVCTLENLIHLMQREPTLKKQIFTVFTSFVNQQNVKKKYEAKLFHLKWGSEDGIVVVLNDITLQEQVLSLKIADANKDKVIACVSHELRTPVNGTLGILQMMEKQTEDPALLRYIKLCKSVNSLQLNIINSMLDLQLLRQNKLKPAVMYFDLNNLLEEVKSLFEFQCQQKGLDFIIDVAEGVKTSMSTDKNRLIQIIINLINNAVKFTFQGSITIRVVVDPDRASNLLFSVEDTGIGIKEENLDKLFKMFGKLEDSEAINTQGVGLGLTISDGLVTLLSNKKTGGIGVTSEFGEGTKFFFSIPRIIKVRSADGSFILDIPTENEHLESLETKIVKYSKNSILNLAKSMNMSPVHSICQKSNQELLGDFEDMPFSERTGKFSGLPSPNKSSTKGFPGKSNATSLQFLFSSLSPTSEGKRFAFNAPQNKSILLVDDNPFNLMIASHFMQSKGFKIHTALNGELAIQKVKEFAEAGEYFKFILMDLQMPILDGYQAAKILRGMMQKEEIPELPIIALSANDRDEDKKKCLEYGMMEHLAKPLKEHQLDEILRKYGGSE